MRPTAPRQLARLTVNKQVTLQQRDIEAERQLLTALDSIDYLIWHRDWDSRSHGDLDIVIHGRHWRRFLETIVQLASTYDWIVVKAYEIERAIISIVLLTPKATLFLDVSITPYRPKLFGVQLEDALRARDMIDGVYVATEEHAVTYCEEKHRFKSSTVARYKRKLGNLRVVMERIYRTTVFVRGAALYVPYVTDIQLLRSPAVQIAAKRYLTNDLLRKYSL